VTLGSHQASVGKSQVHLTPRWIIEACGPFDLDPCAADPRPFDCARRNYAEDVDGLSMIWHGKVWLNPPFDRYNVGKWMMKLAMHGNGIALLHARTETEWFAPVWARANAILFMAKRIKFLLPDGTAQRANSGAPPLLVAFGPDNRERLRHSGIPGVLVTSWSRVQAR